MRQAARRAKRHPMYTVYCILPPLRRSRFGKYSTHPQLYGNARQAHSPAARPARPALVIVVPIGAVSSRSQMRR